MRTPVFCVLLASPAVGLVGQEFPSDGFQPLANGRDLAGWHGERSVSPYEKDRMTEEQRRAFLAEGARSVAEHWRVENGEIVNDGHGAFLTTDREFGDAIFELEYRTVAKADSGIYLRGCPQVQIWDYTEEGGKWPLGADKGSGALWNNKVHERFPPRRCDKPFGEWNKLWICQVGEITWVKLNDAWTVRGVRMENYWDRSRPLPRTGPLQLQTHGGEIRFRNLRVRELDGPTANRLLAQVDAAAFEPIFDGTSFSGWTGAVDSYEIVAGAVRCKPGKGGNVFTEKVYDDFTVRLEFRLPPGGNNGLAIRYPGEGTPAYTGIELQVLDNTAPQYAHLKPWQYHGSAYGLAPAHRGYLRPVGEWNFQQVTVEGSHVTVVLNGSEILAADLAGLESKLDGHVGKDRRAGHFGFCGHGDPVEFRNIRMHLGERAPK
ncbi:MAG TPA: DUF1080 domain-containing protein [bacterium]|nr:DUF1080 domain-containing protein [bacterium]